MSQTNEIPQKGFMSGWNRFWFKPNDPLVIGFMRVMTGLVVLYVHFAYSFDLQAFMGPNAWWDLKSVDRERHETYWQVPPISWDDQDVLGSSLRFPEVLTRRAAVMNFFRNVPEKISERERVLAYLFELDPKGENYADFKEGLDFIEGVAGSSDGDEELRPEWLRKRWEKSTIQRSNQVPLPRRFQELTAEKREEKIQQILAFGQFLPKSLDEMRTVFAYFAEFTQPRDRLNLYRFIRDLPVETEEKNKFIDYIQFWGFDPRFAHALGKPSFSIWYHVTDPVTMWIVHIGIMVVIVFFTLGLYTRTTGVLAWVGTISYIHRSQPVLFGMDQMQNILMMYLVIGDCGQALSLDRLRMRKRAARAIADAGGQSVPWAEKVLAGPEPSWTANLAIRLLQVHFMIIYAASGLSKLKGDTWWDNGAGWTSIANPEFSPLHFHAYEWGLKWIVESRPVLALSSAGIVVFTFVVEIGLPSMIWTRLRPYWVIGSILLHTAIAVIMGLTCFALLMFCMILCYVPAAAIRERVCWGREPKLRLQFNPDKPEDRDLLALLLTFDGARQIEYTPANVETAKLTCPDNKTVTNGELMQKAYEYLPMLSSVGWVRSLPGFSKM